MFLSLDRAGRYTVVLLGLVEAADLADAAHPLVHVVLGLGHQVEGAVGGLDVEDEAVLELLPLEGEPGVHLLTAVQVDDADGLLGVVVLVVLEHVWIPAHPPAAKDEPALLPRLQKRQAAGQGYLLPKYTIILTFLN